MPELKTGMDFMGPLTMDKCQRRPSRGLCVPLNFNLLQNAQK